MEEIIGFWKVNEPYGVFSQWWKDRSQKYQFTDGQYDYCCAEQYMMAQKALLFNDMDTFLDIMHEHNPSEMKSLGRKIKNFDNNTWDAAKYGIVFKGNMMKFSQNERLKAILLGTEDSILCEASPMDKVWGIGMDVANKNFENPDKWKGENLLGEALMAVRETLKQSQAK